MKSSFSSSNLQNQGGKKISNSLRARKRLKKKFFMDSQSYNKIKEDSKAASEPERIEEEVSHGVLKVRKRNKKILKQF